MLLTIGIVTFNGLEHTKVTLDSVRCSSPYRLVAVDNGSTDGTIEWLKAARGDVVLIENGENRGVSCAWNQLCREAIVAGSDSVLISNNDVVYRPDTIDALLKQFAAHPNWGLVSPQNVRRQCNELGGLAALGALEIPETPSDAESPGFFAFILRLAVYRSVGPFDEEFSRRGRAYFEDNDYHRRMKLLSIPARTTNQAVCYHLQSASGGAISRDQFEANRSYYAVKWGGQPGAERFSQPFNK